MDKSNFLLDVWSFDERGRKVFPYKGEKGEKKGKFSVNFTNDNRKFLPFSETDLIGAIKAGKFRDRGRIRMLPLETKPGEQRNAFSPEFYKGRRVSEF
jgi:hypothetical protein